VFPTSLESELGAINNPTIYPRSRL